MRKAGWLFYCAFLASLVIASGAPAQEAQYPGLTPEQQRGIVTLAQDLQKELRKEHCSDAACKVLVMNLALRSGETCSACILLTDSLATALGEVSGPPGVISRQDFASFMDKERLPLPYLSQQQVLVWIGHELRASKVVFGTLDPQADFLSLSLKVLRYESFDNFHAGKEVRARLPIGDLGTGLTPRQSFTPLSNSSPSRNAEETLRVPQAGKAGITLPRCFFMPNPSYTDPARHAKINGSVLLEGIIGVDGRLIDPRIIRGLPYGLNDATREMLKTWRCSPATLDGKPVKVIIPFEVTFRLN